MVISYCYRVGIKAEEFYQDLIESMVQKGLDEDDLKSQGIAEGVKFIYALTFLVKNDLSNNIFKNSILQFITSNMHEMTTMQL